MPGTDLDDAEVSELVSRFFADAPASVQPVFRIAVGPTAPVAGVVLDQAHLSRVAATSPSQRGTDSATTILVAALARARTSQVSVSVRLSSVSDRAVSATLRQFAQAGFVTEIALAESSAEEESIADLRETMSAAGASRVVSLGERRRSVAQRTASTRSAVEAQLVDTLVLTRRDGERRFRLSGLADIDEAARAIADASSATWTTLRTVRWLSDIRRMTERIRSKRAPSIDTIAVLDELHSFAIEVAAPALGLPMQSTALEEQLRALRDRQTALRSLARKEIERASTAVPAPQPAPGPNLAR